MEWGAGKDGEGNKRQDDQWGGLGTMQTKFISFPAKAEAQLMLGARRRSKTSSSLCWARPPLCQRLWLWAQQQYPPPHKLGAQKTPSPQAQGPTPASCRLLAPGSSCPAGHAADGSLPRQEPPTWPTHVAWTPQFVLCWRGGLGGVLRGTQCFGWARGPPKSII